MAKYDLNDLKNRSNVIDMLKEMSNRFNNIRDNLCEPYGLSSLQAVIIMDIYHNQGHTRVTDICKRLNKSTNTISPLINRLIDKGFLNKSQSKKDSRVFEVSLTNETAKIANQINTDVFDYTYPMFDSLTNEQFDGIYDALVRLLEVTEE
ncbi:MAG: winged helix DNA-binding protein [Acholeplasmatales bacterium]|nr:winged helix DNA-binding protein [Acholeplasmatales bacterium]